MLLVESSRFIAKLVSQSITKGLSCEVIVAESLADAVREVEQDPARFLAAVVGLELSDAPEGQVVGLTTSLRIPTIVLTASYDEGTREAVFARGEIVDYFIKGPASLAPLEEALRRLTINPSEKVLVVDDSPAYRLLLNRLLAAHRFQVVAAVDGKAALEALEAHADTMLVITDYEMPNLDGLELVKRIRAKHSPEDLAILGASTRGSAALSAAFLKSGADDFLVKPFLHEEFFCRVYHSVRMLEQMRAIKHAAYTDQLTGLPNRLSFFNSAPQRYLEARGVGRPFVTAMVDIDFFKKINDTYGHAGGDEALVHLADVVRAWLPAGMMAARFGGEEFCVIGTGMNPDEARAVLEDLRVRVEASSIEFEGKTIRFTLSMGATTVFDESLDAMINRADGFLYQAKESGRNRVILEGPHG